MSRPAAHTASTAELVARLRRDAIALKGIPEVLAAHAERVTMRRFARAAAQLEPVSPRRVEDYYWGVVRRRAFTTHRRVAAGLRARLLLASVVADLRQSGMPDEGVFEELVAHYAGVVDPQLLAEYEATLCRRRVALREDGGRDDLAALAV